MSLSPWDRLRSLFKRLFAGAPSSAPAAPHIAFGRKGEEKAAGHLQGLGYRILEHGWRSPLGQIDLIAKDGDTVVFVEVKTRSSHAFGTPEGSVTETQRRRIIRSALVYLKRLNGHPPARFDVVAIDGDGIRHYKNAFQTEGYTY